VREQRPKLACRLAVYASNPVPSHPALPLLRSKPPSRAACSMGANAWHPTSSTPIPAAFRENTLKSFQRAVDCGASFLEFDVQVCADGARGTAADPAARRLRRWQSSLRAPSCRATNCLPTAPPPTSPATSRLPPAPQVCP
jgi:hypothetical protein